jgi:hypothetical protein
MELFLLEGNITMYMIQYGNTYVFGYVYMDMYIMPYLSAGVQHIYGHKMNATCLCDVYSAHRPIFAHIILILILMVAVQCVYVCAVYALKCLSCTWIYIYSYCWLLLIQYSV